jgi:anti-sigma factor RsiW
MADLDRMIGGLRCRDVLARLSEYLDGELTEPELAALEAHAKACDQCGRFGGRFRAVLKALWEAAPLASPDPARRERLRTRLARELRR